MHLPDPVPSPLLDRSGKLTLSVVLVANIDLARLAEVMGEPVSGADAAFILDRALMDAKMPNGVSIGNTLLQLAVHAPS